MKVQSSFCVHILYVKLANVVNAKKYVAFFAETHVSGDPNPLPNPEGMYCTVLYCTVQYCNYFYIVMEQHLMIN
jgi:hypothetical protein